MIYHSQATPRENSEFAQSHADLPLQLYTIHKREIAIV